MSGQIAGAGVQPILGDYTYHVRTDGSDSNDGFDNTPTRAFLTIQHAVDVACGLYNPYGHNVTILVHAGTYTSGCILGEHDGLVYTIEGDSDTTTIFNENVSFWAYGFRSRWRLQNFKMIQNGGNLDAIVCGDGGLLGIGNPGKAVRVTGTFPVGGCVCHAIDGGYIAPYVLKLDSVTCNSWLKVENQSRGDISNSTLTLTGNNAFNGAGIAVRDLSFVKAGGFTWAGGVNVGQRYYAGQNSAIDSAGGGVAFFPGSIAGTVDTGGVIA